MAMIWHGMPMRLFQAKQQRSEDIVVRFDDPVRPSASRGARASGPLHTAAAYRAGLIPAGAPLIKPRKLFKQAEPGLSELVSQHDPFPWDRIVPDAAHSPSSVFPGRVRMPARNCASSMIGAYRILKTATDSL
jgi:hypothetical protein